MEEEEDLDAWIFNTIDEIKIENGLEPTAKGIVCVQCRKMVQSENGLLFCECHDERKGINPNEPGVVPITIEEQEHQADWDNLSGDDVARLTRMAQKKEKA